MKENGLVTSLKLQERLRSLHVYKKITVDPADLDFFWFSKGRSRFSFYRFLSLSPENFEYDQDIFSADEEDDSRDNILSSLLWYDSETFDSNSSVELEEENLFGDENNPMGYHNLSADDLFVDFLSHLNVNETSLLTFNERAQDQRPLDQSFFSIAPGSLVGLDDSSVGNEFLEEYYAFMDMFTPEDALVDDEIMSDNLEFDLTEFENDIFPDIHSTEDDVQDALAFDENQMLALLLQTQQIVDLLPLNHLIEKGIRNSFFRKASFLRNHFIGFDALKKNNNLLRWNYYPMIKDIYVPHISQPRLFFRTWIADEPTEIMDSVMEDARFIVQPYDPSLPSLYNFEKKKKAVFRSLSGVPERRFDYLPQTVEDDFDYDAEGGDFFEDQIFRLRKANAFLTKKDKQALGSFRFRKKRYVRNRYAGLSVWREALSVALGDDYALLTDPVEQGSLFRENNWRFSPAFNAYYVETTLQWYISHYSLIPFKEHIALSEEEITLQLDLQFFTKWRDSLFEENSFFQSILKPLRWYSYFFNIMNRSIPKHPFHIVTPSPWPLLTAFGALLLTTGGVLYMHSYKLGGLTLFLGLIYVIATVTLWWRDVIREASFLGNHTPAVQTNLKIGVALFIVSEIMFFFAFFWAFFHSSLSPAIDVGSVWPPLGITPISPYGIPLFNSFVLALSGYTVTYAHHAMLEGDRNYVFFGLVFTLFLAFLFSSLQFIEYKTLPFLLSDGIYGSTFFMTTGFHALHVIIGSTFLLVCLFRLPQFTKTHHVGFEAAIWYWHFVDVVWLFLWLSIYWWPSLQ